MTTALTADSRRFTAKKALFSFLGRVFRVYSPSGQLRYFVKKKAFRLKEEINVFSDESQSTIALVIRARSVFDFGATYDITHSSSGEVIGSCRRQGLKSIVRDEWTLMGPTDLAIGKIQEDSVMLALLRRFILHSLLPQSFTVYEGDEPKGTIAQRFNPFQLAYDVDCSRATGVDERLLVGAVVLLLSIDGRQE